MIGKYTFQGCYTEIPGGRALNAAAFYSFDAMTLEYCATSCAAYSYFGVEYGGECKLLVYFLATEIVNAFKVTVVILSTLHQPKPPTLSVISFALEIHSSIVVLETD